MYRPLAYGRFPGTRHRPRQQKTAVLFAADPRTGTPSDFRARPLTNAAWLSNL